jgi:hypothetical protein
VTGAIVNVLSFSHPHARSLEEGLWGFPDNKQGINARRWKTLQPGMPILLYGEYRGKRGIWLRGTVLDKSHSDKPVSYWNQNPTGYPYQVKLKLDRSSPESSSPITKEELASTFALGVAKQKIDRWSLVVFGEEQRGVTYGSTLFTRINDEFQARNVTPVPTAKPSHDDLKEMIYQMGVLQAKFPLKEFMLDDGRRLDVAWRKTPKSVPNWAFEVQVGGNLVEALAKLKHAWDLYSSIPVLVTTTDQLSDADNLLGGSFHEIKDVTRLLSDHKLAEFYNLKLQFKELKNTLGIV